MSLIVLIPYWSKVANHLNVAAVSCIPGLELIFVNTSKYPFDKVFNQRLGQYPPSYANRQIEGLRAMVANSAFTLRA